MFKVSQASIPGSQHVLEARNNQDGVSVLKSDDCWIMVVADGLGSGSQSEVGAKLTARKLALIIEQRLQTNRDIRFPIWWDAVEWEALRYIERMVNELCESRDQFATILRNWFCCTVQVGVITPEWAVFTSISDGVFVVNGTMVTLEPEPGNRPPAMALTLVPTDPDFPRERLQFEGVFSLPTNELESFLFGTDGLKDFSEHAGQPFPLVRGTVPSLVEISTNPDFADSPRLQMLLTKMNRTRPNQKGTLRDDTTLVVGQRRREDDADAALPNG